MDTAFLQERIAQTKYAIIAYEDAVTALSSGIEHYSIDTGQDRQVVTRASVDRLNKTLDSLYNRLTTLEARLNGSGSIIGMP